MQLDEALRESTTEYLTQLGLIPVFLGQAEENFLLSAQQVNILTGMYGGFRGNIMMSLGKQLAFRIITAVTGEKNVMEFNSEARKILAEFSEMICTEALDKAKAADSVKMTPTNVITGDRLFLHISKNTTTKQNFRVEEQLFQISFSLDQ